MEENKTIQGPAKYLTTKDGKQVVDKDGKPIMVGQLTTDQVVDGMNYGKEQFVDAALSYADDVNHMISGGLKLAFDPNSQHKTMQTDSYKLVHMYLDLETQQIFKTYILERPLIQLIH